MDHQLCTAAARITVNQVRRTEAHLAPTPYVFPLVAIMQFVASAARDEAD